MAKPSKRGKASSMPMVALAAGGALLWVGLGLGRRRKRKPKPGAAPSKDVEFGEAPFPPPSQPQQWQQLQSLARQAEQLTGMDGLYSYLLATAKAESDGRPSSMNVKTDGAPAFRLFCRSMNYDGRYQNNPWRPSVCIASDPLASRWSYSGGWFQMMPATALATGDHRGHKHDPARVFDPPFAVAYAADLVRRLRVGYGAKTWGDVRAGWALPKWARPDSTADGKAKVIERFNRRLSQVASKGADPNLAIKTFTTKHYPGFTAVLHALLAAEGRTSSAVA